MSDPIHLPPSTPPTPYVASMSGYPTGPVRPPHPPKRKMRGVTKFMIIGGIAVAGLGMIVAAASDDEAEGSQITADDIDDRSGDLDGDSELSDAEVNKMAAQLTWDSSSEDEKDTLCQAVETLSEQAMLAGINAGAKDPGLARELVNVIKREC